MNGVAGYGLWRISVMSPALVALMKMYISGSLAVKDFLNLLNATFYLDRLRLAVVPNRVEYNE